MADQLAKPDRVTATIPACDLLNLRRDLKPRDTKDYFDYLRALAEDIKLYGVRNLLKVVREGTKYRIVCGQTRKDAAVMAGLSELPCEILPDGLKESDLKIIEVTDNNLTRGFDPLALAVLCDELMRENNWSPGELVRNVPAVNKATLSKAMSVFKNATDAVKAALRAGEVCGVSAYQLSRVARERQDQALADCRGMSAESVTDYVNGLLNPAGLKKRKPKPVKGRTRGGLEFGFPAECDYAKAKAEHAALAEAIARAERQGLPLSLVPQLLRGQSPN